MKATILALMIGITTLLISCSKDNSADNNISPSTVTNTLVSGTWRITCYYDKDHDETNSLTGYNFTFNNGGVLIASNGAAPITGAWSMGTDDSKVKLNISFSAIQFGRVVARLAGDRTNQ